MSPATQVQLLKLQLLKLQLSKSNHWSSCTAANRRDSDLILPLSQVMSRMLNGELRWKLFLWFSGYALLRMHLKWNWNIEESWRRCGQISTHESMIDYCRRFVWICLMENLKEIRLKWFIWGSRSDIGQFSAKLERLRTSAHLKRWKRLWSTLGSAGHL